jgi:hypothetical protein
MYHKNSLVIEFGCIAFEVLTMPAFCILNELAIGICSKVLKVPQYSNAEISLLINNFGLTMFHRIHDGSHVLFSISSSTFETNINAITSGALEAMNEYRMFDEQEGH